MTHNTVYGPRRRMRWYARTMLVALVLVLAASGLTACTQALIVASAVAAAVCTKLSHTM